MTRSDLDKQNKRMDLDQQTRAATEVLDSLDRWSQRIGDHFNQKRESARNPYRELVTIYVPDSESPVGEAQDQLAIQAWTRNISRAGLTFIYSENIAADQIVICLNPPGRKCIYLDGQIVRRRQVLNSFWEFGVRFSGRAVM